MTSSTAWTVSPQVRTCLTGDTFVLMDIERDRIYSLDRVGADMWRLLVAGHDLEAIADNISNAYGAPVSVVHGDLLRFVEGLEKKGLLARNGTKTHVASRPAQPPVCAFPKAPTQPAATPGGPGLVAHAVWRLLRVDLELSLRGFRHLYRWVAEYPTKPIGYAEGAVAAVCRALDHAIALYPRQAPCLPRSAATTCLLRDQGVPAALVVGARKHPFRAHAWVEVNGVVVNDKRGVKDYYVELDRF